MNHAPMTHEHTRRATAMLPLFGLVSALLVPRIPPPPRANVQLCDGVDTDAALTAAEQLLADYDRGHQAAAKSPNAEGLGGALTANAWGLKSDRASLADAKDGLLGTLRIPGTPRKCREGRSKWDIAARRAFEKISYPDKVIEKICYNREHD